MIEKFFDEWHAKWQASIGTGHRKISLRAEMLMISDTDRGQ